MLAGPSPDQAPDEVSVGANGEILYSYDLTEIHQEAEVTPITAISSVALSPLGGTDADAMFGLVFYQGELQVTGLLGIPVGLIPNFFDMVARAREHFAIDDEAQEEE